MIDDLQALIEVRKDPTMLNDSCLLCLCLDTLLSSGSAWVYGDRCTTVGTASRGVKDYSGMS